MFQSHNALIELTEAVRDAVSEIQGTVNRLNNAVKGSEPNESKKLGDTKA